MLSVKNLVKIYKPKKAEPVRALNGVSIDFADTGLVFLLGKSGSGKSTLLNAIGGLDSFDEGEIIIKGKSSKEFTQSDFDSYRNTFIGFIFQEYNILENFTVEKNLELAIELQGKKPDKEEVAALLEQVEMTQYAKRKPNQLSGGQKQRVAIARALVKHPEIIMADEPTGALDSNTGKQVMETLKKLSKEKLVIIVSHDREFAEFYGDRIIELKDGKIISDVTKKEVVAEETKSGVKIIDESLVYIKKGQEISADELKKLADMINKNSKNNDTFISFDDKANAELKKGASINDDGNREKFEKTEKEDVKLKTYNGDSLKLIKSKLKFSDSFKMGASSLKNKVGKLVFTILLSFFAFTVFGIVDALSCWNRAASTYEAMKLSNQTNLVMLKEQNMGTYMTEKITTEADLENLRKKFPNHTFKGAIGKGWSSPLEVKNISLKSANDPLEDYSYGGFAHFTKQEAEGLGFDVVGNMPANKAEIAISKMLFENLKKASEESTNPVTDADIGSLKVRIYDYGSNGLSGDWDTTEYVTVVGVVDDKTNWSKYEGMDAQERIEEQYQITGIINKSYSKLIYVSEAKFTELAEQGVETYYGVRFIDNQNGYSSMGKSEFKTYEQYFNDYFGVLNEESINRFMYTENRLDYFKNGKENFSNGLNINLGKNEIIVSKWQIEQYVADYEELIDEGLTMKIVDGYNDKATVLLELTVVGVADQFIANEETISNITELYKGYSYILSGLTGNEKEDKALIEVCEVMNDDGVRFTVQNSTTGILNLLDEFILMAAKIFLYIAIAFALFAALLLMNFISTSINHKKREIGVLRALGARGSDIFGIFFNESTVIAFINFALAAVATIVGCNVINMLMIKELAMEITLLNVGIRQIILILLVSWGSAFLASLIPTVKISKKKPIDAINNR